MNVSRDVDLSGEYSHDVWEPKMHADAAGDAQQAPKPPRHKAQTPSRADADGISS